MATIKNFKSFLPIPLVILLDQLTKITIQALINPLQQIPIIPGLIFLTNKINTGFLLGILSGQHTIIIAVNLLIIIIATTLLVKKRVENYKTEIGLILGGGLSNLIDRIILQGVVDWIGIRSITIFNIADAAIVIGMTFILLKQIKELFE